MSNTDKGICFAWHRLSAICKDDRQFLIGREHFPHGSAMKGYLIAMQGETADLVFRLYLVSL